MSKSGNSRRHHRAVRSRVGAIPYPLLRTPAALVIALLIGSSFSLLATGLIERLYRTLDCTSSTFQIGMGAILLSAALGPRMLRGVALRLAQAARARLSRGSERGSGVARVAVDRDLLWIATGVAGLAAGVGALALPFLLGRVAAILSWSYTKVLWTDGSLLVLEATVVFVAVLFPFALIGFFLRCVHQLIFPVGWWDFGALVWALVGCGVGLAGASFSVGYPQEGLLLLRVGVLPLLLAAIIAIAKASPAARRCASVDAPRFDEPEIGERWPTVLRSAVAVCVCVVTTVVLMWSHVVSTLGMWGPGGVLWAVGLMLIGGGIGLGWAFHYVGRAEHTIGGFGACCAVAGLSLAGGVAVFNLVVQRSFPPFLKTPGGELLWIVCAVLPLVVVGRAIGYGLLSVLRRSAFVSECGSRLLRMVLLAMCFGVSWVGLCLLAWLGSYATLVAASLGFLATGGILTIHAPVPDWRSRGVRVSAIFVAVLLMTWLMPLAGAGWLSGGRGMVRVVAESWWLPHRGGGALRGAGIGTGRRLSGVAFERSGLIDWSGFSPGGRVGSVSFDRVSGTVPPAGFQGHLKRFVLASDVDGCLGSGRRLHGFRALRAGVDRFDLLVLSFAEIPLMIRRRALTCELLDRALARLAPGGVLVAILPDDRSMQDDVATLLAGFTIGCEGLADRGVLWGWSRWQRAEGDTLNLYMGRGKASFANARRWVSHEVRLFDPQQSPQGWSEAMLGNPVDEDAPLHAVLSALR